MEKTQRKLSFKSLPSDAWINFVIIALVIYFIVYFIQPLFDGNWCLLNDFLGYYSAGQIMNDVRMSAVFDFTLLNNIQGDLLRSCGSFDPTGEVTAMLYLPVFLLPFRFFALFDFPISVVIWIILNFTALILYLAFFSKKVSGKILPFQTLLLVLISIPIFRNFIHGQVNIWLLICVGEFIRAIVSEKDIRAGLWLGGLLLKPQLLILILPFLLIQKKYKVLGGFLLSSFFLFSVSYLMVGWDGVIGFTNSILEAASGGGSSYVEVMMNWRAVSYYASKFTVPVVGWIVLISGSIITAALPLVVFRKRIKAESPKFIIALLGVTSATLVVAYHAHTHSAMILIPILLYLYMNNFFTKKMFAVWFLTPSVFNFFQFMVGALVTISILPFGFAYFVGFSIGIVLFVMNLILLGWAIKQWRQWNTAAKIEPSE